MIRETVYPRAFFPQTILPEVGLLKEPGLGENRKLELSPLAGHANYVSRPRYDVSFPPTSSGSALIGTWYPCVTESSIDSRRK